MAGYIPTSEQEKRAMLNAIGMQDVRELFKDVPEEVYLDKIETVPSGLSQMETEQKIQSLAAKNTVFKTILRGAGAYDHYIPAVVDTITGREEFLTTYTPYQAEKSQGVLQSIFEFQTQICELTDMDVSNASVYDGATAAAEACMMSLTTRKNKVLVCASASPETIAVVKTYCWAKDADLVTVPLKDGKTDIEALKQLLSEEIACVYLQQPNFYGLLEDAEEIGNLAHEVKANFIMGTNPISLGMLKTPRECGVDIAVGEGQPLGMPLSFGGPYLGFMASTDKFARKLPGRIVGQTTDSKGRRCFVLTLQAREQHIKREKAGSNICSNQALCAMRASVYMAAMGANGLKQAAELCYHKAHYFASELTKLPGFAMRYSGEFFNEFITETPIPAEKIEAALQKHNILAGLPYENGILWCVTEKVSKEDLDNTIQIIRGVYSK
ncbi:MAG: aminomethyl-transferring glycine dehydrogenase subunit GcvPA [Eubacteriales bacterium]|nr:aminomethyl-transferring glycine dehydrogenase subunit GcvPA [Eubacteriales bacterium]